MWKISPVLQKVEKETNRNFKKNGKQKVQKKIAGKNPSREAFTLQHKRQRSLAYVSVR